MNPPTTFGSDVATGVTFGSYVVGELIGRGAMASVYRAEHVMLNKAVALKLMDRSLLDSPGARERFLREGRVVASITHPNVVNITDVGVHEGTPYLVMELLVGEDLHSHLSRHAPLDDRAAIRLALPLVAALSAAHDAGVVHRDVKPSNIFLEQSNGGEVIPKVLDFGISKLSLERAGGDLIATSPNLLIGSPLYLAPEALRGPGQLGPASDQYSLGVVLYECVTGRTPFQGDTLMALLGAVARGTHPLPSTLRADVSPALERVIERAMALDPKDRFPSLREMGSALLGLAAERTQVVWANSFKPPSLDAPSSSPFGRTPPGQPAPGQPSPAAFWGQDASTQKSAPAPQYTSEYSQQSSLAQRPPSGGVALRGGPASTPLPPLRQPLWQQLKGKWAVAGALAFAALLVAVTLLRAPSPKGARLGPGPSSAQAGAAEGAAPLSAGGATRPAALPAVPPGGVGAAAPPPAAATAADPRPGVAVLPGPLPIAEEKGASAQAGSVAASDTEGKAISTRAHALQPSRRKSASSRERRSRARRAAVTEAASADPTETSETSRASRNEPPAASRDDAEAPASSEGGAGRRGANQSPYLD